LQTNAIIALYLRPKIRFGIGKSGGKSGTGGREVHRTPRG
jgi:hypothetical protein